MGWTRIKENLELHRPDVRGWLIYDWANSTYLTIVIATVFPVFYKNFANFGHDGSTSTFRFSIATTLAAALVAIAAPFLGSIADRTPSKKRFMFLFVTLGVVSTALLATIGQGQWLWASVLFVLATAGAMGSLVFYDAFLPHLVEASKIDRVSTAGYALGYVSGGLLLLLVLIVSSNPQRFGFADASTVAKASFLIVAIWWGVFSWPFFRNVTEPDVRSPMALSAALKHSWSDVVSLTARLRSYPQAFKFLLAFLVFNDGVGTIIKMAAIYGAELGLPSSTLFGAILLVQWVGVPCTFFFGSLAERIGSKSAIYVTLVVYLLVSILGFLMTKSIHFFMLAILIGSVQGGVQALSRSLFASLIPHHEATQFFGLFAVFEKFAGVLGPLLFVAVIGLTGETRYAILGVCAFFIVGGWLLSRVDVEEGRAALRVDSAP